MMGQDRGDHPLYSTANVSLLCETYRKEKEEAGGWRGVGSPLTLIFLSVC